LAANGFLGLVKGDFGSFNTRKIVKTEKLSLFDEKLGLLNRFVETVCISADFLKGFMLAVPQKYKLESITGFYVFMMRICLEIWDDDGRIINLLIISYCLDNSELMVPSMSRQMAKNSGMKGFLHMRFI
jgi:hypothetical protein